MPQNRKTFPADFSPRAPNLPLAILLGLLCFFVLQSGAAAQQFPPSTMPENTVTEPQPLITEQVQEETLQATAQPDTQPEQEQMPQVNVSTPQVVQPGREPENIDDLFYDTESLVPASELAVRGGPVRLNPKLNPASKYIIVKEHYDRDSQPARLVAAKRAVKLGRHESALKIYDVLYKENKQDPNVLLGRAASLQHLGRTDEAIRAYEEFLSKFPDNTAARLNMLGLMSERYPAVALRRLMVLQQEEPNNMDVLAQLALVYANSGMYDEALAYFGVVQSSQPHNAQHLFNMAVISEKAGNTGQAIEYYEQALEIDAIHGGSRSVARETIFARLAQLR